MIVFHNAYVTIWNENMTMFLILCSYLIIVHDIGCLVKNVCSSFNLSLSLWQLLSLQGVCT